MPADEHAADHDQPLWAVDRTDPPVPRWDTIATFVRVGSEQFGGRDAVISPAQRITYSELDRRSHDLAKGLLAAGVPKYARVGLVMPNSPEWVVSWMAIARVGAVAVPLSTFASGWELRSMLAHSDCVAVIAGGTKATAQLTAMFDTLDGARPDSGTRLLITELPHLQWIASSADVSNAALPVRPLAEIIDAGNSVPDSILTAAEQAVHPSDPATMIYTSGSTSAPKGVIHSHRGILTRTTEFAHEFSIRPDDRVYSSMPLFWVGGLGQILLPLLANGACTATLERPDPAAVRALIESERLTRIFLYPQRTATSIVNDPAWQGVDLSSIERGLPGLPGISLTTFGDGMGLGMSETFAAYAWGRPEHPSQFTPPMRRLSAGWSVKVITDDGRPAHHGEEGEILVRGPSLCIGLQKRDRDEVFDADGFYRTGDYVLVDGGALRFRGRRGDMIKSAGANVAAAEVETALRRLEGVDEAFVVGIPDQDRGAVPGAAVVAKLGATLSEAGLLAELGKVLAGYKLPRRILILDSVADIPMTPTGKLRQHELRELLTNASAPVRKARR